MARKRYTVEQIIAKLRETEVERPAGPYLPRPQSITRRDIGASPFSYTTTGRWTVRRNVTIDWTVKENVRARMRVMVKRILRKYGYPPDKQEKATQTVLEQAEVICGELAA